MGKILLVDDFEEGREVIGIFLRTSGHEVVLAGDGRQAVEAAEASRFDAVIMDLSLPVLDGLSAICRLREKQAARGVPVVACTAFDTDGHRRAAAAVGCDAYLVKPFDMDALGAILRDLISSGRGDTRRIASENMGPEELLNHLDSLIVGDRA
jgi:DNA-binding response OmpR family regulator